MRRKYIMPSPTIHICSICTVTGKFVEYDVDGNVIGERVRPLLMRQTYRSEIFLLAELCGFEVMDIYRGYKGDKKDLNDPLSASKYRSNLFGF